MKKKKNLKVMLKVAKAADDATRAPYEFPGPETASLVELRTWIRPKIMTDEGARCPCCKLHAKVYRRHFNASMAYALVLLAQRLEVGKWTDMTELLEEKGLASLRKAREWSRLQFWKLIEAGEGTGSYCLTQLGSDFAAGRVEIPEFVYIYDGKVLRADADRITISKALGEKYIDLSPLKETA